MSRAQARGSTRKGAAISSPTGGESAKRATPTPAAQGRWPRRRRNAYRRRQASANAPTVTTGKATESGAKGTARASQGVRIRWPQGATVKTVGCSAIAT